MFYFTSAVVHLVHDKYLKLFTTKIFYIKIKLHIYFLQKVSKYTCFYHAFVILIFIKSIPNQVLTIIYTHFQNFYLLFICSLFIASVHSFWGISNHTAFFSLFWKVSLCHVRNINKWNHLAVIINNICYLCTKLEN